MKTPIQWPLEAIWEAVAPDLPGFSLEVLPQIDSTNTELMRRARAGRLEPVLLVAECQTAGRGRLGREWLSGQDDARVTGSAQAPLASLTFSIGLPLAPADWSGLSLAVGVSVAQSLHPELRLKWPNDLWWCDRKMAGILIETVSQGTPGSARYAVVGVGINIAPRDATGLATPPAWLQEVSPGMTAEKALLKVAAPLVQALKAFEAVGFGPYQARFNALDALQDVPVSLSNGTLGVARGVNAGGALQVHTAQGLENITSSEVSVRPQSQPPYDNL
ncbi:MAG: biotin--[acetyl-CoA-carboxylase] ligase [Rhodoferax sp.]|nr:biotin--[acetyl-CoA-carboxylase] ligase [Rhodoferax sp.]